MTPFGGREAADRQGLVTGDSTRGRRADAARGTGDEQDPVVQALDPCRYEYGIGAARLPERDRDVQVRHRLQMPCDGQRSCDDGLDPSEPAKVSA